MASYTIHYWKGKGNTSTKCGQSIDDLVILQLTSDWDRVNCPECQALRYPMSKPAQPIKVIVHVKGGVAYVNRVPNGVEVKIIDHDRR